MLRDALRACDAVHRRMLTKSYTPRRIVCRRSYFAFTTRLSLITVLAPLTLIIGETGISAWDYTLLNVWDATCPARRSCRRRHVAGPTRDPGQEAHRVRVPSVLSRVRPMRVSLAESHPANHRRVALAGVCPPGRGKGTRSTGWLVSPVRASFSCSCLITRSGSRLAHFARSGSACRSFEPCSCLITRSGSRLAHFCPVGLHFARSSRAPASSPVRARGSRTFCPVGLHVHVARSSCVF